MVRAALGALRRPFAALYHRFAHPQAHVSLQAHIGANVSLGRHVVIQRDSYIANSILGDHTTIQWECSIDQTCLEGWTVIRGNTCLHDAYIGKYSYISNNCHFGTTKMGRFCSVGGRVLCGTGHHPLTLLSTSPVFYSTGCQCGTTFTDRNAFKEGHPITIGNDVWIGTNAFIRDGATIGNGAVIGAGAVVVKDVPAYAIVGGVPAKLIKYRFTEDIVLRLQALAWWSRDDAWLRANAAAFAQENVKEALERLEASGGVGGTSP